MNGAILFDQVKNLDWKVRKTEFSCKLDAKTFHEVVQKLGTLIREL